MNFSSVVLAEIKKKNMKISGFAKKIGFSLQYTYSLLHEKGNKRWNEDSMKKACEILEIEIQFISKSA